MMKNVCEKINKKMAVNFLVGGFLFFILIFPTTKAQAATSTVRGIAWWGDIYGEVYFNCLDDNIGDRLDVPSNLSGSGKYLPPNDKFHFYVNPCLDLVHGVYIDDNNNFSGQALNAIKGLISFSGASTPPDNYATTNQVGHCPSTCNGSNNCWACYNENTQSVYGWARVDADGTWIRLDSGLTPSVMMQNCNSNSVWPGYSIQSGDFVGYASSSIANLSFNCKSESGGSACATRNYKVYIGNLTIGKLSAPNWTYEQACYSTARGATLQWCKRSGTQTAYEVAVSVSGTLSTSTAICYSGIKDSDFAYQYNLPNTDPSCGSLGYNQHYYWWVRLYDELGVPTGWYQYNTNSVSDTDGNPDGSALTFTTYKNEFPNPYEVWFPYNPLVGTSTLFSATSSQYYSDSNPTNPLPCVGIYCEYLWWTDDEEAFFTATTSATTTIVFMQATGTTVRLTVTDINDYYCSTSTVLRINYDLPIWREIKAK